MKVIGYGDNVVDRYINKSIMFPGGNCINFAVYASKIGIESSYLGMFGDDREAKWIMHALEDLGVDYSRCRVEEGSVTERCDVSITDEGNRVFEAFDERENLHDIYVLDEDDIEYLKDFDLIHCSCYAEELSELPKLADMPGLCAFDFSEDDEYRTDEYLNQVCPYMDFTLFSCEGMSLEDREALAKKVHGLGVKYVLLTMGPEGQMFFDGNKFYEGQAKLIEAKDTMGAGDSFFTAFLMSLLKSGWNKTTPPTEDAINTAFEFAADFAANNCLVDGAFGYACEI